MLVLRAHAVGAALLVGGHARTAEGQLLVESGWASEIVADRATVRAAMPRVVAQGESDLQLARDPLARAARLPSAAFEAAVVTAPASADASWVMASQRPPKKVWYMVSIRSNTSGFHSMPLARP